MMSDERFEEIRRAVYEDFEPAGHPHLYKNKNKSTGAVYIFWPYYLRELLAEVERTRCVNEDN